ncbi:hypothetical protein [Aliarcobacter butzleri]|uniref:hypothetical protein n=1 Tax=Aliarcobacter butzleri TaxID=28197 RepID=UPI001269B8F6|nr:hypothetical protein [Aliarcobacter butzleri]
MKNKYTHDNLMIACMGNRVRNGKDHFNFTKQYGDNEFFHYEIELNYIKAEKEIRKFLIKNEITEIYADSDETGIIKVPTQFASFETIKKTNLRMIDEKFPIEVYNLLNAEYKLFLEKIENHSRRQINKEYFEDCLNTLICLEQYSI